MSNKDTVFYRGNTAVSLDFPAEDISSNGALLLLEKLERKHKQINYNSKCRHLPNMFRKLSSTNISPALNIKLKHSTDPNGAIPK
jgi:hypothetical protein